MPTPLPFALHHRLHHVLTTTARSWGLGQPPQRLASRAGASKAIIPIV